MTTKPSPYQRLANRLDSLPNGFPATKDGAELRLLQKLYTPEQADLASRLRIELETAQQIADRTGVDPGLAKDLLKEMARNGLIRAGRAETGLGYGLLPFVVGIYEYQLGRIDAELAQLFEDYFQQAFQGILAIEPQLHRVIPIDESVDTDLEIQPYESACAIIDRAQAWGVQDCICRVQKKLVGDPCQHPVDVCMVFSSRPDVFQGHPVIRALTRAEAHQTLQRAANAGLVHSVSNSQDGTTYICNCCTCSCGILRGLAEMGLANVVARSAFVNTVDPQVCVGCETCIEYCQFGALALLPADPYVQIDTRRCVGCGVCVPVCPDGALKLVRRPVDEIPHVPKNELQWMQERAQARGLDLDGIR
ncbi:MAG: 4Fe-4S binding protein [Anaerolineales bacterium]|nr:4Fe-4S binding protein [Anaerolineales bacterium]